MSDEPAPMRLALIAPPTATVPPSALGGLDVVRWLAEGLADRGHEVTLIGAGLQGLTADRYAVVDTPSPTSSAATPSTRWRRCCTSSAWSRRASRSPSAP